MLDAAVRKTRKAVQEEKHVPPRCAPQTSGKTSDSELGGIHFAHFPGDKGYYKNSSNVSLSGSTAWKSVGKTAVLIILFISPTFRNYE